MTITDIVAIVLVVAIQAAGMVVVFMVLTRRGWWKDDIRIDWTSTDGCPECWEHGPYEGWRLGTLGDPERAREMHKAQHALIAPFARLVMRLVDLINRRLAR